MAGGSFLVARRIRMLIEQWDRAVLKEQEAVIGRSKRSGAPLGGKDEFDELDLDSKMGHDFVIPEDSHVRLASAEELGGIQILRRGYNFTDGSDGFGHLDAGLFFRCVLPESGRAVCSDAAKPFTTRCAERIHPARRFCGLRLPRRSRDGSYWGSALFA